MKDAKVFISHAKEEELVALKLKDELCRRGIEAWSYEKDLPFTESIAPKIEGEITECDHLLVILSDTARYSEWVARELGLALALQAQRGELYPSIIGIRCDSSCSVWEFEPREFRSGRPTGMSYSFSAHRYFDLRREDLSALVVQLLPKVTIVSTTEGKEGQLLDDSFRCYESLFPDESLRDPPEAIKTWLEEGFLAGAGYPWPDIYAVLHMEDHVIGMAYFSLHLKIHWCFANYFGVKVAWRPKGRAQQLIREIEKHIQIIDPENRGILFEVDPINRKFLSRVAKRKSVGGHPDHEEVFTHLRCLRRLIIFQEAYKASAVLKSDGNPLPYWQPAMKEGLKSKDEREQILMIRQPEDIGLKKPSLKELLDFIYDDFYGAAYGEPSIFEIPGYQRYVARVKNRVKKGADAGWKLGKVSIEKPIYNLSHRAHAEGFSEQLEL